MEVVVVESPAKAKTINRYLGADYKVLASYGHVRDLPAKDGSVDPEQDFAMLWEVDERGEKRIKEIAAALKDADSLILATDPDREGEAISWHITEELSRRRLLQGKSVKRVVFNEVTKGAVREAFSHPRDLDQALIQAYLARRALDYLVGFTLSPVLWRKLPGSRSAGRVQSVALRLICEREAEIEVFQPQEYWTLDAELAKADATLFRARLTHLDGEKLDKFSLGNEAAAKAALTCLEAAKDFCVSEVERKDTRRNPYPPFTTSTLQQEASRKLRFGATKTMRTAQRLYEGVDIGGETQGLITYMRTDGVQISQDAIHAARDVIDDTFGEAYLPASPRIYKSKAKNAQEAHEAIRPTDLRRHPKEARRYLSADEAALYELIWNRTLASQMAAARIEQVGVDIAVDGSAATLRATGSVVVFDGFLKLYQESKDDPGENGDGDRRLPPLAEGEDLERRGLYPEQHFTQPPPRYSEASLVKRMEELGIGRPSTYASILQVLQDREYVRLDKRRFLPEDRGRLVTAFLSNFFARYVEYNFTADLETQLDDISAGSAAWTEVLTNFWQAFRAAVEDTKKLSITEVIDALDDALGPHFFPTDPENPDKDPRLCQACGNGRLGLRLGKSGGFVGCSNYPDCRYTRPLAVPGNGDDADGLLEPRLLGQDPESNQEVSLRKGPFGPYVQLGNGEGDEKPKRVSLPKGQAPAEVDLLLALKLLALPRVIGPDPESGKSIYAGIGRFGPYVRLGTTYRSLQAGDDVLSIGLNRAVALLAENPNKRGGAGRELGKHPEDEKPITLHAGRYGPYVKHGRLNASLPKDANPDSYSLEEAVALLETAKARKAAKKGSGKTKKAAPKTAKRKTASRKSASGSAAKSADTSPDA